MSYGSYGPERGQQGKVPDIVADAGRPLAWVEPDPKQPLAFHAAGQSEPFSMIPLYQVMHDRYAVYWKVKEGRKSVDVRAVLST